MMIKPGTRHHTLQRVFRHGTIAAFCASFALACSGSVTTQETPDDDDGASDAPAAAASNAKAASSTASSTAARPASGGAAAGSAASTAPAAASGASSSGASSSGAGAASASGGGSAPAGSGSGSAAAGSGSAPAGGSSAGAGASTLSFETDIWPIFSAQCGPCHTTAGYGGHNIGSDDKTQALSDAKTFKDGIIREIEGGTMPPTGCGGPPGSSSGCVSAEDFQKIQDWFDAGSPP